MALTRQKKIVYALLASALAGVFTVLVLLAADVFAHARTQEVGGVNVWGYRGRPVPRKQPGEVRIAMLGGSTVFGWGLPSIESVPAFLERRLNHAGRGRFSVVNLGAPAQGAYGFLLDLEDFAYLDYEIALLYEGYNDLPTPRGPDNFMRWRRQSPVFNWTGYFPILPVVLREKADVILGRTSATPAGQVQFDAGLARRAAAGAMTTVADLTSALGNHPGALHSPVPANPAVADECIEKWRHYCGSVRDAVAWTLARNKKVIFITQPYVSDAHVEQQANVAAMLRARFGQDARVQYVNLGRTIDLTDAAIAYDGLHLVAKGNDTIAASLVDPVLAAAQRQ